MQLWGSAGAAMAKTTILGFGSLLSEQSSRLTFPDLENFRLVRVPDYRRLMQHPASIFFQRGMTQRPVRDTSPRRREADAIDAQRRRRAGIADPQKKNWCSLSAEPCPGASFVACAFEVVFEGEQRAAYELREEEFHVVSAPYTTLDGAPAGEGLLCAQWTDEGYRAKYGDAVYEERYGKYGVQQIWGWPRDCGATPCPVYLRHCVLAAEKAGPVASDSFLDETWLVDRETTVRAFLATHPEVMATRPPPELVGRYSG